MDEEKKYLVVNREDRNKDGEHAKYQHVYDYLPRIITVNRIPEGRRYM
jgi:hypothetical protein